RSSFESRRSSSYSGSSNASGIQGTRNGASQSNRARGVAETRSEAFNTPLYLISVLRSALSASSSWPEEITRIMAFGVRDADVEKAVAELAIVLQDQFLPVVEKLAKEAFARFKLEPCPDGPAFSVKWSGLLNPVLP